MSDENLNNANRNNDPPLDAIVVGAAMIGSGGLPNSDLVHGANQNARNHHQDGVGGSADGECTQNVQGAGCTYDGGAGSAPRECGRPRKVIEEQVERTPKDEKELRDYELYLGMAKSLTLQLPYERDRVIASKWVQKIETCDEEIAKRLNYLKLLCLSTFQHRLAGPFQFIPSMEPELDDLGQMTTKDFISAMATESTIPTTPYYVELSGDLKEYAAYQEIPGFGAHFYYAFSNETILNWHNEKRAIVPSGGLNYPILSPPLKAITKSAKSFKETYSRYSKPTAKTKITKDLIPTLVPELDKRKIIMREDITLMGTKKCIGDRPKCTRNAAPNLIGSNFGPKSVRPGINRTRPNVMRSPAFCGARRAAALALNSPCRANKNNILM